jgi:hypothetical protein
MVDPQIPLRASGRVCFQKRGFSVLAKAAQGFSGEAYTGTPQSEKPATTGRPRPKRPFLVRHRFPGHEAGFFPNIKESKRLCGDAALYVAQANAPIDAEIGKKDPSWAEISGRQHYP